MNMNAVRKFTIEDMSIEERLELIGELWDSLDDKDVPITDAQKAEIERRLESFASDKAQGIPWSVFRQTLGKHKS